MTSRIRAAFDIGSSHHKLTVARVDVAADGGGVRVHVLHSSSIRVGLADALCADGTLCAGVLGASRAAMRRLVAVARGYGAVEMCGIATAVFRAASNGAGHLAALGMPVSILSAADEGQLAYDTALYYLSHQPEHQKPQQLPQQQGPTGATSTPGVCASRDRVVVWDSGGGSTQFTDGAGNVFGLPFGSGMTRNVFGQSGGSVDTVRRFVSGGIAHARRTRAKVRGLDAGFRALTVVGIGSDSSMFAVAARVTGAAVLTAVDAERAVHRYAALCAHDAHETRKTLPKLILLAETMRALGIARVTWVRANGSCVGLLLSNEARFWAPPAAAHAPAVAGDNGVAASPPLVGVEVVESG